MSLLELFRTSSLKAAEELRNEGLKIDVSEIATLELISKCSVNIESDNLLGNLAMWSSGECDLLVTDAGAERVLVNDSNLIKNPDELSAFLDDVFSRLRSLNRRAS
jgi:hypothetical protein